MRITLDLEDDVIAAARALAERRGQTLDTALSELIRALLVPAPVLGIRNGIRLFPARRDEPPVTPELVARLLAEG